MGDDVGTANVTHKLSAAETRKLLTSPQGGTIKDMLRRGKRVESAAKKNLGNSPRRINTGHLRGDIKTTLVMTGGIPAVRVGTHLSYAMFVHEGTGLYGPLHKLIVPKTKKALRWRAVKGGGKGGYIFSKSSRGMRRNQFLKNALSAARG